MSDDFLRFFVSSSKHAAMADDASDVDIAAGDSLDSYFKIILKPKEQYALPNLPLYALKILRRMWTNNN